MDEKYAQFIEYLQSVCINDTGAKAKLKRSLAFKPGSSPHVFPYVEHWVLNENSWSRSCLYLVAGLYAMAFEVEEDYSNYHKISRITIGTACGKLFLSKEANSSIEKRFMAVLDSDRDQLFYRLRQLVSLLGSSLARDFDWLDLLKSILRWHSPHKRSQIQWAKDFYSTVQNN